MKPMEPIFSKWIIEGMPGFVIGSDREMYRLPFASYPNHYELRRLKRQSGRRWKLDGVWWSERQLKPKLKLNPAPEVLLEPEPACPF